MKLVFPSLLSICICLLTFFNVAAQQPGKQMPPPSKTSQPQEAVVRTDESASRVLQELFEVGFVKMTDEEKLRMWKNPEKVILLPNKYLQDSDSWGVHLWDSKLEKMRFDNLLPGAKYIGKTGIIVEPKPSSRNPWFYILLDDTNETVKTDDEECVGFLSEMEIAQTYIGKHFWAKGSIRMRDVARDEEVFIPNLTKLTVSRIEWGHPGIFARFSVYFKTPEGRELLQTTPNGVAYVPMGFLRQYYFERVPYPITTYLYPKDPRELFPGWSKTIWQLIEKGEVAIGMTSDMAQLACAGRMIPSGAILSQSPAGDELSIIYACEGKYQRFLVEKGKVTKYVEPQIIR